MRTKNAMQLKAVIRNKAKEEGVPPQLVMQNYLLERLLERISLSAWRDSVVIKGGMLIGSLVGVDKRSTKDLDTTVRGFPLTHENAERAFREIAAVEADDDFAFEFVRTEGIRETDDYPGIRVPLPFAAVTVDSLRHGRRVARTARAHTRSVGGRAADNPRLAARVRASGQGVRQNNIDNVRRAVKT